MAPGQGQGPARVRRHSSASAAGSIEEQSGISLPAEVRLYGPLLLDETSREAEDDADWKSHLDPDSLETLTGCRVEPSLADAGPGHVCQFERQGYFCVDADSTDDLLVFNRTVTLRDRWARIQKAQKKAGKKR